MQYIIYEILVYNQYGSGLKNVFIYGAEEQIVPKRISDFYTVLEVQRRSVPTTLA